MSGSIDALAELVQKYPRLVVLTGAGISVDSGIPPYRDHGGNWLGSQPIQHQEFIDQPQQRQRYWARSAVGWPAVQRARPNPAHQALAGLEAGGYIRLLVTQNVDRLHQQAGQSNVIDLHGRLDQVICLSCQSVVSREQMQRRLLDDNPLLARIEAEPAPDGDALVAGFEIEQVRVPPCGQCGGILKPDVVFFGGAVPVDRVARVADDIARCDALLVIGSSLMVYSGFRFCRLANRLGKRLVAINQGKTRADELLDLKVEQPCAAALTALKQQLMPAAAISHES